LSCGMRGNLDKSYYKALGSNLEDLSHLMGPN
jgi:hypothetical protein